MMIVRQAMVLVFCVHNLKSFFFTENTETTTVTRVEEPYAKSILHEDPSEYNNAEIDPPVLKESSTQVAFRRTSKNSSIGAFEPTGENGLVTILDEQSYLMSRNSMGLVSTGNSSIEPYRQFSKDYIC